MHFEWADIYSLCTSNLLLTFDIDKSENQWILHNNFYFFDGDSRIPTNLHLCILWSTRNKARNFHHPLSLSKEIEIFYLKLKFHFTPLGF